MFNYEIKGITLDINDMTAIHDYYEAACTAEYIMENYGVTDKRHAIKLGYNVRYLMDKYGYDEIEAIEEVIADYGGTI